MMDPLPALRAGLTLGKDAITDTVLGRRIRLDASFLAVAAALPGSLIEVSERAQVDSALVTRIAHALDAQHLLDTEAARVHVSDAEAIQRVLDQDPDTVSLIIRDDAAFTCTQCGSCCGGHNIGPILPDTLEALSPHMSTLATTARLSASPFVTLPSGEGDPSVLCRTQDGWCVFLNEERRCTIHATLGGPAKPRVCQLFPWEFKATPAGIAVTVSNECRGFAEARHGQPVADREAELRRLLQLIPPGHLGAIAPRRALRPGVAISFDAWSAKLDAMHEVIDAHAVDPAAACLAMRNVLEPSSPSPDDDDVYEDLRTICDAMRRTLQEVARRSESSSESLIVRTDGITLLTHALETMPRDLRRVLAPLERQEHGELFATLMHHRLASHELLEATSATHGLAWLTFGWLLSRASAIRRTSEVKRRHIVSQDLIDSTAPLTFVLRAGRVRAALQPFDDAVLNLFFHRLDALIALGCEPRASGERVELHTS